MVSPGVGEAGLALSALKLIADSFSNLNLLRHTIGEFRNRVQSLSLDCRQCQAQLSTWDTTWSYGKYSDEVYCFLWGNSYDDISTARADVSRGLLALTVHIRRVLGIHDSSDSMWRRHFALHRKPILRRFAFALLSEASLTREITQLKANLKILTDLSGERLNAIRGLRANAANFLAQELTTLANLCEFGKGIFQKLQLLGRTSEWALELRSPEGGGDVEKWRTEDIFRVWFSFVVADVGSRRIFLQYQLAAGITPDGWMNQIVDLDPNNLNVGINPAPVNPEVATDWPHVRKTRPFRTLFKDQFFEKIRTRKQWELDQACLLLSLSNWALLLWTSQWTKNLCCSSIRYVKAGTADGGEDESLCLHSLVVQPSHVFQVQQVPAGECHHLDSKLKNLGLTLAEAICASPFRQCRNGTSNYEKWEHAERPNHYNWVPIRVNDLLGLVYRKSNGSLKMREVIDFCLTTNIYDDALTDNANNLGAFYLDYIDKIHIPIKSWCEQQKKNHWQWLEPVLYLPNTILGTAWPAGAYEGPAAAAG